MKKNAKCADDKWNHIRGVAENSYFCSLGQEGWWGPGFLLQGMQNLFLGNITKWDWSGKLSIPQRSQSGWVCSSRRCWTVSSSKYKSSGRLHSRTSQLVDCVVPTMGFQQPGFLCCCLLHQYIHLHASAEHHNWQLSKPECNTTHTQTQIPEDWKH